MSKNSGKSVRIPTSGNFGIAAKFSLGQHFLTNPHVVEKMVAAAKIKRGKKGQVVLEIGPGTGVLTEGLLDAGANVIALEADGRAIAILQERFKNALASGQLVLHHADVRNSPPASFAPPRAAFSIVANIPYYLSGMLLRTTLENPRQPKRIVFLVQKEVAARVARGDKESLLSLSVKAYGNPRYVATVSRGNFAPSPKVDSAILLIDGISRDRFKTLDETWFFRVLHAGFSSRRKQLLGNLTALYPKEALLEAFTSLNIPPNVRGEDLSIDTWCALAEALSRRYDRVYY